MCLWVILRRWNLPLSDQSAECLHPGQRGQSALTGSPFHHVWRRLTGARTERPERSSSTCRSTPGAAVYRSKERGDRCVPLDGGFSQVKRSDTNSAAAGSPCFCTFWPSWVFAMSPSSLSPPSSAGRVHVQRCSQEGVLLWETVQKSLHSPILPDFCLYLCQEGPEKGC